MKTLRFIIIATLLLGIALSLGACGGSEDQVAGEPTTEAMAATNTPLPQPTDTPVPPPTDTPVPPPTTTSSGEGSAGLGAGLPQLEAPDTLDSFRSNMVITWSGTLTDSTEVNQSMQITVEFVRDPLTEHVSILGDFPGLAELGATGDAPLEIYTVNGMMYMNMLGSWLQIPADQGGFDADQMAFTATEGMLSGLENTKDEGITTYNGVETHHYSFDQTSFGQVGMTAGMDIESATGNIYLATDGNYVVHMDSTLSGANLQIPTGTSGDILQQGDMSITVDMTDVNAPITIEVPAEALASSAPPEDIPVPEDAEDVQYVGFMGMLTFISPGTTEALADYYKTEMPNNGWTQASADEMQGISTLEFTKDERKVSMMITVDDAGKTSALITIEEGGE